VRFEFLAYPTSVLREHSVVEGHVTSEKIWSSLVDFSKLLRMPSNYAARIVQAFTATDPTVKVWGDQWEEQPDLGEHIDGVGTIFPQLRDMTWEAKYKATRHVRGNRVPPFAFQLDFSDTRQELLWARDFRASRCACASRSATSPCTTLTRQSSK
jgi:RNA-dependent RNA polymerase